LTAADLLGQTYPIVALAAICFLIRWLGILHRQGGESLAGVIVHTTLPATIFLSIARTSVSLGSVGLLITCSISIPLLLYLTARVIAEWLGVGCKTRGVFLASPTISNLGFFLFPFFAAFYGAEGLGRLAVYDIGNSLIGNSFTYYLAVSYGDQRGRSAGDHLKRVLTLPTLWAGILGLAVSLAGWELPTAVTKVLEPLAQANLPLAMLTVGVFIELRLRHLWALGLALFVKMGLGWGLGQVAATSLGLQGLDRLVVTVAPAMPVGLIVLVYAAREGLDTEFAANLVSLSILAGLVIAPLLLATG